MLRKLFSRLSQPQEKEPNIVYKEYRRLLRKKLLPLGFSSNEGSGMGNYSIFKREDLEVTLAYDLRDRITFLDVKSSKKFMSKTTLFDHVPEEIRKEALEMVTTKTDISLTLNGTDEEKGGTMKSLDDWLTEHP